MICISIAKITYKNMTDHVHKARSRNHFCRGQSSNYFIF